MDWLLGKERMALRLGILDQSIVFPEFGPREALQYTVELAQLAEQWGYERFWVSEHHGGAATAGSSPEVLIAYLLAHTKTIHIGSGGVMLQHYSPYKVAENFNVLANLEPGRVDLGIGRAPGGFPLSTRALQHGISEQQTLAEKLDDLGQYLSGPAQEGHVFAGLSAAPLAAEPARVFILGTSVSSAVLAAERGYPYVYSLAIHGNHAVAQEALATYRQQFRSIDGGEPLALLGLSVVVTDTQQEADELAGNAVTVRVTLADGTTVNVGSLEQAELFAKQAGQTYQADVHQQEIIKGTPAVVEEQLLALQERYGVAGFIVNSSVANKQKRFRSFELLGELISRGRTVQYAV